MAASTWASAFAIAMLLTHAPPALAQTRAWTIVPSIGLRGTYNDNVSLAATPEHGEFITDIIPGLSIAGRGRRFSANLNYSGDVLFYARDKAQDRVVNNLNGFGNL